jgi:hypothetical protein
VSEIGKTEKLQTSLSLSLSLSLSFSVYLSLCLSLSLSISLSVYLPLGLSLSLCRSLFWPFELALLLSKPLESHSFALLFSNNQLYFVRYVPSSKSLSTPIPLVHYMNFAWG